MKTRKLSIATTMLLSTFLGIQVQAADLTASSDAPTVLFVDSTNGGGTSGIVMNKRATDTWYNVYDQDNNYWLIHGLITSDSHLSMDIQANGDINLANGSVFIDRSSNNVGIGTVTPQKDLHIVDTTTTTSGTVFTQKRGDASIQLGAYDDTDWSLGANYNKLNSIPYPTKTFTIADLSSNTIPFTIKKGASTNTLYLNSLGVGIGTSSPNAKLDVRGDIKAKFSGASTAGDGLTTLMTLDADNSDAGKVSDVAFVLRNGRTGKQWNFRTTKDGQGFAATIQGTGGTEFEVVNDTNDFTKAKLYIGGKLVFANGKIQANVLP